METRVSRAAKPALAWPPCPVCRDRGLLYTGDGPPPNAESAGSLRRKLAAEEVSICPGCPHGQFWTRFLEDFDGQHTAAGQ